MIFRLLPLPKPEWKVFGAPRPISFTLVKQNFNKSSQEFRRRPLYPNLPRPVAALGRLARRLGPPRQKSCSSEKVTCVANDATIVDNIDPDDSILIPTRRPQ